MQPDLRRQLIAGAPAKWADPTRRGAAFATGQSLAGPPRSAPTIDLPRISGRPSVDRRRYARPGDGEMRSATHEASSTLRASAPPSGRARVRAAGSLR